MTAAWRLAEDLGKAAEIEGIGSLTPAERVILLACRAKGILDNGGFAYFYEGVANAREVAAAFDALGLPESAEACRLSPSVFPNGQPQDDEKERVEWLARHAKAVRGVFDAADGVLWNLTEDELDARLDVYLKANAAFVRTDFFHSSRKTTRPSAAD